MNALLTRQIIIIKSHITKPDCATKFRNHNNQSNHPQKRTTTSSFLAQYLVAKMMITFEKKSHTKQTPNAKIIKTVLNSTLFFTPGNSCCLLDSSRACCGKPFLFTHFLVLFLTIECTEILPPTTFSLTSLPIGQLQQSRFSWLLKNLGGAAAGLKLGRLLILSTVKVPI